MIRTAAFVLRLVIRAVCVTAIFGVIMGGSAMADILNFDNGAVGAPPDGWTLTMTGKGQPKWTTETDATAPSKPNVLKQSGQATFPVALRGDT